MKLLYSQHIIFYEFSENFQIEPVEVDLDDDNWKNSDEVALTKHLAIELL